MMKIERVALGDLRANEDNPRTISGTQLEKLKMSLLVLPKMMELRPIVVDDGMVVLGGNQRLKALTAIAGMSDDEVSVLLQRSSDYSKKTKELLESWGEWRRDPTAPIVKASELSDEEKRQFVIKDNVGFGDWDIEALEKDWEMSLLEEWGLDDLEELFADAETQEETETAKLSDLVFTGMYYEPEEEPYLKLEQCVDREKFDAKIKVIEESGLSDKQKEVMKLFAYRFLKINFEGVANYYAFNASEEEKRVIERLRMVLVDGGVEGFIEDDLLKVRGVVMDEEDPDGYE